MDGDDFTQIGQGQGTMPTLKLFVACHKKTQPIQHPILHYIQAGSVLAEEHFDGMLHDDFGINISDRNKNYSELTALYWVWKNVDADYYGFCHYRRFPSLNLRQKKRPYAYLTGKDTALIKKAQLDIGATAVDALDIIIPQSENMFMSVKQHYQSAPAHDIADLETAIKILKRQHPEYSEDADGYLSDKKIFFGNIFVMKRKLFFGYCEWLFSILEEFDRTKTTSVHRTQGYVAERLFGIFIKHLIRTKKTRIAYTQRIDILRHFPHPVKRRILYTLCPPGSKRRAIIKQLMGTL